MMPRICSKISTTKIEHNTGFVQRGLYKNRTDTMNDQHRVVKFKYFRPTRVTGMDGGQYFIGFAKQCKCTKMPLQCECKPPPSSINSNGIESGDIFFDRKSFIGGPEPPTFQQLKHVFKSTPIIMGYSEEDTGKKNSGKMILKWKIPSIGIPALQIPVMDLKKETQFKFSPNLSQSQPQLHSESPNTGPMTSKMLVSAPIFIPKVFEPKGNSQKLRCSTQLHQLHCVNSGDNIRSNNLVFSEANGTFTHSMWVDPKQNFVENMRRVSALDELPKDSKLWEWMKFEWDTSIPCLTGLSPPLFSLIQ